MAGSQTYPFQAKTYDLQVFMLYFEFKPNGTDDPTLLLGEGISSVARDDVGVYTVTLSDTWVKLINCNLEIQLATEADTQIQMTSEDVAGGPTITFTILTAGTAADVTAAANDRVRGTLWVSI